MSFTIFLHWLFLFFMFNVIGWAIESTIESVNHKRLLNRGFLSGPYIPIYGLGGVLFALLGIPLKSATEHAALNVFLVFFVGAMVATLLEYAVGSFLERTFKKQFWDYSQLKLTYKFTYKNRISLVSSIFFGLCALFQTYFLYERASALVGSLDLELVAGINIAMLLIMGTDTVFQVRRYVRFRTLLKKLTYEQMRETLMKSLLKMGGRQQIREFRDTVRKNLESMKENAKENAQNLAQNLTQNLKDNVKKNIQKIRGSDESEELAELSELEEKPEDKSL
jgi:uncharacterized membrane protein